MIGYLEKIGLLSGSSTSDSTDIRPSLRTLASTSYNSDSNSMYSALVYFEPLRQLGSTASVDLITLPELPTKNAPMAAPPIMMSSTGWNSEWMWPPAMAKPPNTATQMIT